MLLLQYVPDAYRNVARGGSLCAKSVSVPPKQRRERGARTRRGLAAWRSELSDPSWRAPRPDRSAPAAPRSKRLYVLTPMRRPPRRAELMASLGRLPISQRGASGAPAFAHTTPGDDADDPGSDDEWQAVRKSLAAAAAAIGPDSVARVSTVLCPADEGAASAPARPASPKYEERVDYAQVLKAIGCEVLSEAAFEDVAATPAAVLAAPAVAADAAPLAPALRPGSAHRGRSCWSLGRSQITPPSRTHASTPVSQVGFAVAGAQAPAHVTVLVLEVFAAVRGACFMSSRVTRLAINAVLARR